ncbi:MAG: FAD-dependent oxidoreductase [Phycisphaerae bacterium]|nr:FAD-dependent oxidoreductase [Gemmatimonadaceae bacterium]
MKRWPSSPQVLVVGGGPAGASTAWHLALAGVEVLLVDRAAFPRDKPCGEYLSPEGSRILESMGALKLVEQAGAAQLAGMTVHTPSGATIRGEFVASHGFRGFRDCGLALRRNVLDKIVLDRARVAGVTVVEGAKVEQVLHSADGTCCGVVVRLHDELHEIPAQFVIGADGLRSVIARRLDLTHYARRPRRFAMVAHYANVRGMGQMGEMFVKQGAYLGLCNVGNGVTNIGFVVSQPRGTAIHGAPAAVLDRWIAAHPDLRDRFQRAERIGGLTVTGPFASHAKRAWAPGAALVGDAADFFDPFTGEGMYAALRGGEILAPYVAEALGARNTRVASQLLAEYDRARTAAFAGKWRVEKLIGLAVGYPWLLDRAAAILHHDRELADLLVGVTGNFVPPRELLRLRVLRRLFSFNPKAQPLTHHAHRS